MSRAHTLTITCGSVLILATFAAIDTTITPPPLRRPSPASTEQPQTPAIRDLLVRQGFTVQESAERTLLQQVATDDVVVHTIVLLHNNDRGGLLSWIEAEEASEYFRALKEALGSTFSPELADLKDTVEPLPDGRERHILSFYDPALSEEQITLLRQGSLLLEFHIPQGKEGNIEALMETLR